MAELQGKSKCTPLIDAWLTNLQWLVQWMLPKQMRGCFPIHVNCIDNIRRTWSEKKKIDLLASLNLDVHFFWSNQAWSMREDSDEKDSDDAQNFRYARPSAPYDCQCRAMNTQADQCETSTDELMLSPEHGLSWVLHSWTPSITQANLWWSTEIHNSMGIQIVPYKLLGKRVKHQNLHVNVTICELKD